MYAPKQLGAIHKQRMRSFVITIDLAHSSSGGVESRLCNNVIEAGQDHGVAADDRRFGAMWASQEVKLETTAAAAAAAATTPVLPTLRSTYSTLTQRSQVGIASAVGLDSCKVWLGWVWSAS